MLRRPSHHALRAPDPGVRAGRVAMTHVEGAEPRPAGRRGLHGGRRVRMGGAGRLRPLGDGRVDLGTVSSGLAAMDFAGRAVVEWERRPKRPEDGAASARGPVIRVTPRAFDDFAGGGADEAANERMSGLDR